METHLAVGTIDEALASSTIRAVRAIATIRHVAAVLVSVVVDCHLERYV